MTPLRFSMMTATLLAFAATVHGQAPPEPTCPGMCLPTWMAPYLEQSMQTWKQVRGFCTGQSCESGVCGRVVVGAPGCCKSAGCATAAAGSVKCCETAQAAASCCCAKACGCCEGCKAKKDETPQPRVYAVPLPSSNVFPPAQASGHGPLPGLFGGIVLSDGLFVQTSPPMPVSPPACPFTPQANRDLKIAEFYQRTGHPGVAQFYHELVARRYGPMMPPMPVPYQTTQVQAMPMPNPGFCPVPPPCNGPVAIASPYSCTPAPPMPAPPPMAHQVVEVHAMPAQPMCVPPPAIVHVADCVVATPAPKHAHLVTPDLEAHCLRMTHQGDKIILEGDVILVNKKHAQPIRIEAQRAIINMKDGSVTVEGTASTSGFGVTRTSAVAPVVERAKVEERRVKAIRLRNHEAVIVAKALNDYLRELKNPPVVLSTYSQCFAKPYAERVTLVAEPVSNSLLVSATPEDFDWVVQMISQIDEHPDPAIRGRLPAPRQ